MEPIRVLIADDHPLYRDGLRAMLGAAAETELVGEAATGDEAIAQAADLQPDVVLMDLQMPGTNGIEATRRFYVPLKDPTRAAHCTRSAATLGQVTRKNA